MLPQMRQTRTDPQLVAFFFWNFPFPFPFHALAAVGPHRSSPLTPGPVRTRLLKAAPFKNNSCLSLIVCAPQRCAVYGLPRRRQALRFSVKMAEAAETPQHRFFCYCCKGETTPKLPVSRSGRCRCVLASHLSDARTDRDLRCASLTPAELHAVSSPSIKCLISDNDGHQPPPGVVSWLCCARTGSYMRQKEWVQNDSRCHI